VNNEERMLASRVLRPGVFALPAAVMVLFTGGFARAQVRFEVRNEAGVAGAPVLTSLTQNVIASVFIVNPAGASVAKIQGFQMAIASDPAFLDFQSATFEGTALKTPALRNNLGPAFFQARETTSGAPGITLGVVFEDTAPAPTFFLEAGEWKVAALTYKPVALTPAGTPTRIEYAAAGLGSPPVTNGFSDFSKPAQSTIPPASTSGLSVEVGTEQSYTVNFRDPRVAINSGSSVTIPIMIQNTPKAVDGFSFGVKHDAAALDLVDVTTADGLRTVLGTTPEDTSFQVINKTPAGGAGFTVAFVISTRDPAKVLDPAKSPHHVFDVTYRAKLASGSTEVDVTDQLGQPKVEVILDLFGVAQRPKPPATNPPPTKITVDVTAVTTEKPFLRGDADQNHRITVTDAIGILRYQFDAQNLLPVFQPTVAKCLIAFNVNGDTNASQEEAEVNVDLSDAIYLFNYLFLSGTKPPEPFGAGNACAAFTGKATDRMKCVEFNCGP